MASLSPGGIRGYRWKELGLLVVPFILFLLAMIQLLLANTDIHSSLNAKNLPPVYGLIPVFGLVGAWFVINVIMSVFFRKADQVLLPLIALLSGIGVMMATRLGPDIGDATLGSKQLVWVMLGLIIFLGTMFFLRNIHWLERYKYTAAFFGIVLVCISLVNTLHIKNFNSPTHDQLNLGPINFQPSELLKICIVIFFAAYLDENREILAQGNLRLGPFRLPPLKHLGPMALMMMIALLFFLVVREMGLALLIYGLFLCMLYLGSGKWTYVISSLVILVALGLVGYKIFGYIQQRFSVVSVNVLDWTPRSEALYSEPGGAFQVVQGLIALCSGGIFGAGLGLGAPAFVPVAQSDMVLTALGEELGLAGLFAVIGIYLLIVYRGYRIAIEAPDSFQQLLAAGLTSIFAIQTLIISAGNLKFFPLTGIPLPFISYGGSSIFANFIIIGILLRISYNTAVEREGLA
jgi:cell division protein FtsW (lipid II flippase)